jgi:hypothetical protein
VGLQGLDVFVGGRLGVWVVLLIEEEFVVAGA